MRPRIRPLLLACLLAFAPATALQAQTAKIFVASFGNDANDGSRGSPKRNFQAAHDAVASGGQIVVLDTAGYGTLAITKSIAVTVPQGVNGFVTFTATSGSAITINAASTDVVSLRGLIVEGVGVASNNNGIFASSVAALTIEDCTVRSFLNGIIVKASCNAQYFVRNTNARACGRGLEVSTNGAFSAVAAVADCRLEQNSVDGLLAAPSSTGSVDLTAVDCAMIANGTGIETANPSVVVRVSNSTITNNATGISVGSVGGQVLSRGNNTLEKNAAGNTFPGAYSPK